MKLDTCKALQRRLDALYVHDREDPPPCPERVRHLWDNFLTSRQAIPIGVRDLAVMELLIEVERMRLTRSAPNGSTDTEGHWEAIFLIACRELARLIELESTKCAEEMSPISTVMGSDPAVDPLCGRTLEAPPSVADSRPF